MKKLICLAFSIMLIIALMTGCDNADNVVSDVESTVSDVLSDTGSMMDSSR